MPGFLFPMAGTSDPSVVFSILETTTAQRDQAPTLRGLEFPLKPISQAPQCCCDFLPTGREVPFAGSYLVIRSGHFEDNMVLAPDDLRPEVEAEQVADYHRYPCTGYLTCPRMMLLSVKWASVRSDWLPPAESMK